MTTSKQSKADLMYITGWMLIFSTIPVDIVVAIQSYHYFYGSWRWTIIAVGVMTTALAVIGGLFLCIANIILKRRRTMTKKDIR
jgi:hypothetical protein